MPPSLPTPAWELFHIGNQCDNTQSLKPLSSFGMWLTSSISLPMGVMNVISTWIFVILTGYCHIGSQSGWVPTWVHAWRLGIEGGVAGRIMRNEFTKSRPDHTKLPVQFQPWNCWGLCSQLDVGPPLFTAGDANGRCQNWPVWSSPHTLATRLKMATVYTLPVM